MRQFRTLTLGLAIALVLAGCGTQNSRSAAENEALQAIHGAKQVISYPIPASDILAYLPKYASTVGKPAYAFTIRQQGSPQPLWVIAGPSGAKPLKIYPDLASSARHAAELGAPSAPLETIGGSALGRLKLAVIGAHLQRVRGKTLRKLGLKLPRTSYDVLAVVTLPARASAPHLDVAHFVIAGGKVVGNYGGSR